MSQRLTRWMLPVLVLAMVVAAPVWAQPAGQEAPPGPDPNQPAADSILKYIPGDSLGFVVIPDLKKALDDVQTFTGNIGLGEQLGQAAPDGLLAMLGMLGLGEGYNPNGGVAIVMTDLKAAGLDLKDLNADAPPTPDQFPILVLAAGKSALSAFPQMAMQNDDGSVTVQTPLGVPLLTAQVGPYVALSTNQKVLDGLKTLKPASQTLPKLHAGLLAKNDIGVYYNMKAVAPLMRRAMEIAKQAQEQQAADGTPAYQSPEDKFITEFMGDYANMMDQVGGVAMGFRLTEHGMVLEGATEYVPDSTFGKMVLSMKPTTDTFLDRLPNQPYVLAMGGQMPKQGMQETFKLVLKMVDGMLKANKLEMPEGMQEKFLTLADNFAGQLNTIQFVGGGSKTDGVFGIDAVMDVNDADATSKLIAQKADLLTEFVHATLAKEEKDLEGLQVTYVPNVATVDGLSVDAVNVTHPDMATMKPDEKAEMKKAMGDTQLRWLIAKPNAKTVVATFGGGETFLADSIAASKSGGTIDKDPGVQTAMKHMPEKRVFVMVFCPKNLLAAVRTGAERMGQPTEDIDKITLESDVPIAAASTTDGSSVVSTLFVPIELIKEGVGLGMKLMAPSEQDDTNAPPPSGNDF